MKLAFSHISSGHRKLRRRGTQARVTTLGSEQLDGLARTYYERAWSSADLETLNEVMADEHTQFDQIWRKNEGVTGRSKCVVHHTHIYILRSLFYPPPPHTHPPTHTQTHTHTPTLIYIHDVQDRSRYLGFQERIS